jgi:hypothetical protein
VKLAATVLGAFRLDTYGSVWKSACNRWADSRHTT